MNICEKLKLKLRFSILAKLRANFYSTFNLSHFQFGEDMLLRGLTQDIDQGFYVEIGAHHSVYISNTYHFYCRGWRGINIDAIPGSMESFKVLKPRDINLEACITPSENSETKFFTFEQSAFNTCDSVMAKQAISQGAKLAKKITLPTTTITKILDTYLSKETQIDFMSIDIEGLDEQILMSNNWNRYKPTILLFEKHFVKLTEIEQLLIMEYIANFGYELVAKYAPSLILKKVA